MNEGLKAATPFLNPYLREFSYPQTPVQKIQPHYKQSSRETATPSIGTSPSASF